MFTYILWRFLILETFVLGLFCCPCVDEHPQKQFCKSDFVLKVEIHEEIEAAKDQVFAMEIKKVFKGNVRELILIENRDVYLIISSGCRDPNMANGDKYLIYGFSIYGIILLSPEICHGSRPWWRMPAFVRRAVEEHYYKDNCDCSPEINYDSNDNSRQKICKSDHSYMRRSGEKCKWANSTSFRRCLKYGSPGLSWK